MAQRTRITMTASQAASAVGQQLIDLILKLCHDGCLEIQEIEELHVFLRTQSGAFAAIDYLRSFTRTAVADGAIDEIDAYQLKKAFLRVVPKEVRGVVGTHLESIGTPQAEEGREPSWHMHEATARQMEYISVLGGVVTAGMTKGDASRLIDDLLRRRPPTARQIMLIRFFNKLDLLDSTKDEVGEWIDMLYTSDSRYERAWERYKRDVKQDRMSLDYEVIPIGAYRKYFDGKSAGGVSLLGRLFAFIFGRK